MRGLCERIVVEVNRIFDGCITRIDNDVFTTQMRDFSIVPVPPLTFIQAQSRGQYTPVRNLRIVPIGERGQSRVMFETFIPTTIEFEDATGQRGTALEEIVQQQDLIMRVPRSGLRPYRVESIINLESARGRIVGTDYAVMTCCMVTLTRIIAPTDILIPTYGIVEFDESETAGACQMLFDTPMFPEVDRC
jgi:hypothetical protein